MGGKLSLQHITDLCPRNLSPSQFAEGFNFYLEQTKSQTSSLCAHGVETSPF